MRHGYTLKMDNVPDITAWTRRRTLGICVITLVPLLHHTAEYLGNHDRGRFFCKLAVLLIGLPLLLWGASVGVRWAARKQLGAPVLLSTGVLVAGAVFAALLSAIRAVSFSAGITWLQPATWSNFDVVRVGFIMGVTNFALWALAFVFPFAVEDARVRALEAEKLRTVAELAQLRAHLEPHFLLNTLNAIAGLVTEDPRGARRLLASLGDLLRDSLNEEDEMQTLDEQIEWLRRYAQILEVRHAGHLSFHWEVGGETRRALLPRLLLQPLVENAVKHGALRRHRGGEIIVRTEVVDATKLVCTIEDNGPGLPEGDTRPGAFGLVSVRRRLELRYANAASLRLESSASGARSIVELPLQDARVV
ncbi:sensor histidine kinase [Vitiosangium sp. GDMCC 1.1324]|uniref:sensor histidine kinase n=1 Tax=Vitiosangium sp. (strain GDMCC 1.1324) TaxID=2138576 RepID=UPI00130E28DA|nr:histidine kinase [Vitiosangium sp. GDMCC 1.1324]